MDFELKIKGTPAKFAVMVDFFNDGLLYRDKNNTFRYDIPGWAQDIPPEINLVKITFNRGVGCGMGWITAQSLPDNNTLLIVWLDDDWWADLEPVWILLFTELKRNDWLIQDKPATSFVNEKEGGPWIVISNPRDQMIVK